VAEGYVADCVPSFLARVVETVKATEVFCGPVDLDDDLTGIPSVFVDLHGDVV
jgi:hypothetical protein